LYKHPTLPIGRADIIKDLAALRAKVLVEGELAVLAILAWATALRNAPERGWATPKWSAVRVGPPVKAGARQGGRPER
jgi:hypothetical protein